MLKAENDNNTARAKTKREVENPFPHGNTEEELEVECKDFMETCTYVKVYFIVVLLYFNFHDEIRYIL